MKQRLLNYIICPICKGELALIVFTKKTGHPGAILFRRKPPKKTPSMLDLPNHEEEIWEGRLTCQICEREFPIINGIPRLLPEELLAEALSRYHRGFVERYRDGFRHLPVAEAIGERKRVETMRAFGYQWTTFLENFDYFQSIFYSFVHPYLEPKDFQGKLVLDVGCGSGRPASVAVSEGAEVIGIDISEAIESAYALSAYYPNFHGVQADACHLPFKACFDFAYSVGVIHHIPNPEDVFKSVAEVLLPKRQFVVWVYGKREFWYRTVDVLRKVTVKIPHPVLHVLAFVLAGLSEVLLLTPYRILSSFRATQGIAERIPGRIFTRFPFRENVLGWFDRLAAPFTQYFSRDDVEHLFNVASFEDIEIRARIEASASWTARGIRHP